MKIPFCTDCDAYQGELLAGTDTLSAGPGEAYFFGPGSRLSAGASGYPRPLETASWIDNYAYEALVVGVFITFCFLVYRYRDNLLALFKMQTMGQPLEKMYEEQTLFFKSFLRIALLLSGLLLSALAIRLLALFPPDVAFSTLGFNLAVPAILVCVALVMLYRYLMNGVIGTLTQNPDFFACYRFMGRVWSALGSVSLVPLFLIAALYEAPAARGVLYLLLALLAVLLLGYLGNSLRFFVQRNVSILQWILYLCAVEIFPLSLLLFLFLRSGGISGGHLLM